MLGGRNVAQHFPSTKNEVIKMAKKMIQIKGGKSFGFDGETYNADKYGNIEVPYSEELIEACSAHGFTVVGDSPVQPVIATGHDPDKLREDGPTVAEYVKAGYSAMKYPPNGYVSKSTPEEIHAARVAEDPTYGQTKAVVEGETDAEREAREAEERTVAEETKRVEEAKAREIADFIASLSDLGHKDLVEICEKNDIDIKKNWASKKIIAAITAHANDQKFDADKYDAEQE